MTEKKKKIVRKYYGFMGFWSREPWTDFEKGSLFLFLALTVAIWGCFCL